MKYLRSTGRPSNKRMLENGSLTAQKKRKEYRAFPAATTPTIPDNEDEHSNARNYKLMLSESKKNNPNTRTIKILMERTFPFRRQDILNSEFSLNGVLQKYPPLQVIDEVIEIVSFIAKTYFNFNLCTMLLE